MAVVEVEDAVPAMYFGPEADRRSILSVATHRARAWVEGGERYEPQSPLRRMVARCHGARI